MSNNEQSSWNTRKRKRVKNGIRDAKWSLLFIHELPLPSLQSQTTQHWLANFKPNSVDHSATKNMWLAVRLARTSGDFDLCKCL